MSQVTFVQLNRLHVVYPSDDSPQSTASRTRRRRIGGAFDRSASVAEHLTEFLTYANRGFFRRCRANLTLFGRKMRTPRQRLCGLHFAAGESLEQFAMTTQSIEPLALRPREAAKALGISTRTLWGLTAPRGPIPCLRIGHGKRQVVLYSVAELKRWLAERVAESMRPEPSDMGGLANGQSYRTDSPSPGAARMRRGGDNGK
jgi:hypothetical protein